MTANLVNVLGNRHDFFESCCLDVFQSRHIAARTPVRSAGDRLGILLQWSVHVRDGCIQTLSQEHGDLMVGDGRRSSQGVSDTMVIGGSQQGADGHFGDIVGTDVIDALAIGGAVKLVLGAKALALVDDRVRHEVTRKENGVVERHVTRLHDLAIALPMHENERDLKEGIVYTGGGVEACHCVRLGSECMIERELA